MVQPLGQCMKCKQRKLFFFNLFMKQENYNYGLITIILFFIYFHRQNPSGLSLRLNNDYFHNKSQIISLFIDVVLLVSFLPDRHCQSHTPQKNWFFLFSCCKLISFVSRFKYNLTSKNIRDSFVFTLNLVKLM